MSSILGTANCSGVSGAILSPVLMYASGASEGPPLQTETQKFDSMINQQPSSDSPLSRNYQQNFLATQNNTINRDVANVNNELPNIGHRRSPCPVIPEPPRDPNSDIFSQPLYVRWMYSAASSPVFHHPNHFPQQNEYIHHPTSWQGGDRIGQPSGIPLSDIVFPASSPNVPMYGSRPYQKTTHLNHSPITNRSDIQQNKLFPHYRYQQYQMSPASQSQISSSPVFQGRVMSPSFHQKSVEGSPPQDNHDIYTSPTGKQSQRKSSASGSCSSNIPKRSFSCYVAGCEKSYSTGAGLRYHLKSFHDTITPRAASIKAKSRTFCCPECPLKAFSTAAGLRYHCRTVHP